MYDIEDKNGMILFCCFITYKRINHKVPFKNLHEQTYCHKSNTICESAKVQNQLLVYCKMSALDYQLITQS